MEKLRNITPGEILNEEFLIPFNITEKQLSNELNIPYSKVSEIIKGTSKITVDIALRLSRFFGNSSKFWLGIQADYDIEKILQENTTEFNNIRPLQMESAC